MGLVRSAERGRVRGGRDDLNCHAAGTAGSATDRHQCRPRRQCRLRRQCRPRRQCPQCRPRRRFNRRRRRFWPASSVLAADAAGAAAAGSAALTTDVPPVPPPTPPVPTTLTGAARSRAADTAGCQPPTLARSGVTADAAGRLRHRRRPFPRCCRRRRRCCCRRSRRFPFARACVVTVPDGEANNSEERKRKREGR